MSHISGLTKNEASEMSNMINIIVNDTKSTTALNARKELFNPKQKLAKLRFYFDRIPSIKLTDEELDSIKKVIVKPKSAAWSIIKEIIKYQKQLSESQVIEWFEYIQPLDRLAVSMVIIEDSRITDIDYKLNLVKNLLDHVNYRRSVITFLDNNITANPEELIEKIFWIIMNLINVGNDKSKQIANLIVKETKFCEPFAHKHDVTSIVLYEITKNEQYLPSEAKDIFMF